MPKRIAVVGLGAVGSMTLWQLAARGTDVTGFDAQTIGSDRTGFGGETRLFRVAYAEGACFSDLLRRSRSMWVECNESRVPDVFVPCGVLTIGSENSDYMEGLVSSVRETGATHEALDLRALNERFPQHKLLGDDIGIYDPAGGVLRTEIAVIGAVERARAAGALVHSRTPIESMWSSGGRVVLGSGAETWSFDEVVVCAGAWSRPLLVGRLRHFTKPLRICLTWYSARKPHEFTADRFPAFIRHSRGVHLYGTPTFDGSLVKAAGVIPSRVLNSVDRFERDVAASDQDLADDAVRQFLPGLHPTCVRSDSYLDMCSGDSLPIVGRDPQRVGVYVATGFSGKGFKMCSGVGEAVAEELTTGERPTRLAFAAPDRCQRRARWGVRQAEAAPRPAPGR